MGIMNVYYFVDELPISCLYGVVVVAANLCGGEMIAPRLKFSDSMTGLFNGVYLLVVLLYITTSTDFIIPRIIPSTMVKHAIFTF